MSTVEERFNKVTQEIESVVATLTVLRDMGIYGRQEQAAGVILISTLERAMIVLDPEKALEYTRKEIEKSVSEPQPSSPMETLMNELQGKTSQGDTGLYM